MQDYVTSLDKQTSTNSYVLIGIFGLSFVRLPVCSNLSTCHSLSLTPSGVRCWLAWMRAWVIFKTLGLSSCICFSRRVTLPQAWHQALWLTVVSAPVMLTMIDCAHSSKAQQSTAIVCWTKSRNLSKYYDQQRVYGRPFWLPIRALIRTNGHRLRARDRLLRF